MIHFHVKNTALQVKLQTILLFVQPQVAAGKLKRNITVRTVGGLQGIKDFIKGNK